MKLPGDLQGGLILFGLAILFSFLPLYVMRKTRAFKATRVVKLRQEGAYVYAGVEVNGKVIVAMYDVGKAGTDISIPSSIAATIPNLRLIRTESFSGVGTSEERRIYSATAKIGDGPPLSVEVDVGRGDNIILLSPRLVAESGYTPVLTLGNPRFVPVGMTTVAAVEVPLRRATEEENPSHIPILEMIKINGKRVERMHYDTGASVTFLLRREADRIGVKYTEGGNATVTMQIGDTKPFTTRIAIEEVGFNTISTEDAQRAGYTPVWSSGQPRLVPKGTTITA